MNRFLTILIIMLLASIVSAQINPSWTYISNPRNLPTGVSIPAVVKMTPFEQYYVTIDLDASTYDNANQVTAFAAIGAAVEDTINGTFLDTELELDTTDIIYTRLAITDIQRVWDTIALRDKINIFKEAEDIFAVRVRVEIVRDPTP